MNGEEVKGAEYYRRMEYLNGSGRVFGNEFIELPPGLLTLEQLITERLVFQLAKEKGVFPSDTELQTELNFRLESNPRLLEDWQLTGRTRAELEHQIRFELAQFKIATFGITITDQQVEQFYKDNGAMYTIPKRVTLRVIALKEKAMMTTVDNELKAKTFAEVARKYSDDISKLDGGNFGTLPLNSLQEPLRTAIANIKIGQTTPWLAVETMNLKFMLENVLPESKPPLDAKMKQIVRRRMLTDQGKVRNDIQKEMADMRKRSKISITQKEFQDAYDRLLEKMGLKEPSAPPVKPNPQPESQPETKPETTPEAKTNGTPTTPNPNNNSAPNKPAPKPPAKPAPKPNNNPNPKPKPPQ